MSGRSHHQDHSRKRSRWGAAASGGDPTSSNANTRNNQTSSDTIRSAPGSSPAVSDEDALRALQQEATAREKEQQQEKRRRRFDQNDRHRQRQRNDRERHQDRSDNRNLKADDYYGPASSSTREDRNNHPSDAPDAPPIKKDAPNFGLSGALSKDTKTGGMYKGVLLKFQEPPEARAPNTLWRFYVFKGEEQIETLHISKQSAYLVGRNAEICDISVQHPSCSSQHAVVQYRALPNKDGRLNCQPYIMDLESTNGTFLNGIRIDAARYYQLKKGDVLKFGASTREYVLLTSNTTSVK